MVCSGTFGNGREFARWVDPRLLGGVITKAVTLRPCGGNAPPRLWEVPCGLLNSIGLENQGLERFLEEDLPWLSGLGVPVWVNVAGFDDREYVEVAREVSRSGMASALELNISCPNVERGGWSYLSRPHEAARLVERVRKATELPLFVKLSARVQDMEATARLLEKAGADGLSLVNTMPAMAVDVETGRPMLGNVTGGLSGPALHPVAVLAVWEAYRAVRLPIIGMGGVWSCRDMVEFIMVGARAVAVGTLNFRDPRASVRLVEELERFMVRKGYDSVAEMVGLTHRIVGSGTEAEKEGAGEVEWKKGPPGR
jgi:dihydroorotate dehydrogenase (NAD+) catalytic subunit